MNKKFYVLYDARAKAGPSEHAIIYVTALTEAEAIDDGQDTAWADGIWIEYEIVNGLLSNGRRRWDLPPACKKGGESI